MRGGIVPILQSSDVNALAHYDFRAGDVPGLTFNNAVSGFTSRDGLELVPSGKQRRSHLGLLGERQSANKCTNTNLKPTDLSGILDNGGVTIVVDRASLPSAYLDWLNTNDPQQNVTANYLTQDKDADGGNVDVGGAVGNLNSHTVSIWAAGTGNIQVGVGGILGTSVPLTSEYKRIPATVTPSSGTQIMRIQYDAGADFVWFGNQLEEYARRSLIEVSGATATRLGDNVETASPADLDLSGYIVRCTFSRIVDTDAGRFNHVWQLDAGSLAQPALRLMVGDDQLIRLNDAIGSIVGAAVPLDTTVTVAAGLDGTTMRMSVDGNTALSSASYAPGGYSTLRFACSAQTDDLGANLPLDGYLKTLTIINEPATAANVERYSRP